MPMIREAIVTTIGALGEPHLAPLGLIAEGEHWILAPFHPSTTLENLRHTPFAVANLTDDVRIFAGCLTGRRLGRCRSPRRWLSPDWRRRLPTSSLRLSRRARILSARGSCVGSFTALCMRLSRGLIGLRRQ